MQWINLVSEDAGVQNLKADNRRPTITRGVDAVSPYPSVRAPHLGEGAQQDARQHRERRADDRRAGAERRKQHIPVMLDTRSKHDRRAIEGRRSDSSTDANAEQPSRSTHLNLYA